VNRNLSQARPFPPSPGSIGHIFLTLLLGIALLVTGCSPPPPAEQTTDSRHPFREIDHRSIPELPTAAEQLSYALSRFTDLTEQRAALKAVATLHPKDRRATGLAALELAYLELGEDYRLAGPEQKERARQYYQRILSEYPELAEVAARAHWYLGWIATELEADTAPGLVHYLELINRFPEERLSLPEPAPWLTIDLIDDSDLQRPTPSQLTVTWADLARLEIVRHSADRQLTWQHLLTLTAPGSMPQILTRALTVMVEQHGTSCEIDTRILSALERVDLDELQRSDLQALLARAPKGGH
jgi:tetratricopeptide (TPR) repeat protein